MPRAAEIARIVAEAIEPKELMQGTLVARYGSVAAWARKHGWFPEFVYGVFAGDRVVEDVRNALAAEFRIGREIVDEAIPAKEAVPAAS